MEKHSSVKEAFTLIELLVVISIIAILMALIAPRFFGQVGKSEAEKATAQTALVAAREALPKADKELAAMLVKRDAFDLAGSLSPLTGDVFARYVFGIGVVGMALSSIIILMLISGFVVCEMLGLPAKGSAHRWACMLPVVGVLGPFIWSGKTQFWLAVPTSVFGMVLIPIAYWTFLFLMNSRSLLGDNVPKGGRRVVWNTLMLIAAGLGTFGSVWVIWNKAGVKGFVGLGAFLLLALIVHFRRRIVHFLRKIVHFLRKPASAKS